MKKYTTKDFPNYVVKKDGSIYSKRFKKNVKPFKRKDGYLYVVLTNKNKEKKGFMLHRVIAYVFLNLTDELVVDHIDKNKTNNKVSNLRACTQSENVMWSSKKRKSKTGIKNLTTYQNLYYVEVTARGKKYRSKGFKNIDEAIKHRNLKVQEMHGDFSVIY